MCMEDNGKRMLSWDIVKGITILIMIVGHVASIPQQLRNFIFSFHMPAAAILFSVNRKY